MDTEPATLSVTLYDIATGGTLVHHYETSQDHALPRIGDILRVYPAGVPLESKAPSCWRVDTVIMSLSQKRLNGPFSADLLVYPVPGPHWTEAPAGISSGRNWAYTAANADACAAPDFWPALGEDCQGDSHGVIRTAQGAAVPACGTCGQRAAEFSSTVTWAAGRR